MSAPAQVRTETELAAYLQVTVRTIRRWRRHGLGPRACIREQDRQVVYPIKATNLWVDRYGDGNRCQHGTRISTDAKMDIGEDRFADRFGCTREEFLRSQAVAPAARLALHYLQGGAA